MTAEHGTAMLAIYAAIELGDPDVHQLEGAVEPGDAGGLPHDAGDLALCPVHLPVLLVDEDAVHDSWYQ
jgi:hypothetical protein